MMEKENKEKFGKLLATACSINRKIIRMIFDLEKEKNELLRKELDSIKSGIKNNKDLFFFEDNLDFSSIVKILKRYKSKNLLVSIENYDGFENFLINSRKLRNDIWHNLIQYDKKKRYYNIIYNFREAYERFQSQFQDKKELFENCKKYFNLCLEFFKYKK